MYISNPRRISSKIVIKRENERGLRDYNKKQRNCAKLKFDF